MNITTKRQMYDLFNRGLLGNKVRTWANLEDCLADNSHMPVSMRYAGPVPRGPLRTGIPPHELPAAVSGWIMAGWDASHIRFSEDPPDHHRTLQGQICQSDQHYDLTYTFVQKPMRWALRDQELYAHGLTALLLVRHYMDPASYDDMQELMATYPGAVIEFTSFDINVGERPGRNTVFWEVRHY